MTTSQAIDDILAAHATQPGALLPVLHAIQEALGHVPPEAVAPIARALNRSVAEVHGVLCHYPFFRQQPPGRHVLRLCRAEACQANGGEALAAQAERSLGCGFHQTSADGAVTLEPVYCLGHCAVGPALQIDETEMHARLTPERLDALLDELRTGR
jgi:formate dehydrogenase subunit gamma